MLLQLTATLTAAAQPPLPQPLPIVQASNRIVHPVDAPDQLQDASGSVRSFYFWVWRILAVTLIWLVLCRPNVQRALDAWWKAIPWMLKPREPCFQERRYRLEIGALERKIVVITGAAGGIGFELLRQTIVDGKARKVYAGVRKDEDIPKIRQRLRSCGVNDVDERVQGLRMDISSFEAAHDAGMRLTECLRQDGGQRVHAYIGTIGVAWLEGGGKGKQVTQDGIEWFTAINAVNNVLLLLALRDFFAPSARVLLLSSLAHQWCTLPTFLPGLPIEPQWHDWPSLEDDQQQRWILTRYAFSKLTLMHVVNTLNNNNSLLPDTRVIAVNPSEVYTRFPYKMVDFLGKRPNCSKLATLFRNYIFSPIGTWTIRTLMLRPEAGADSALFALMTSESASPYTYVSYPPAIAETSQAARSEAQRQECWKLVGSTLIEWCQTQADQDVVARALATSL